jgi:CheY-like chemotaxis protein
MVNSEGVAVLVLDDDYSVRGLLHRWLHAWGYRVVEAESAKEALQIMLVEPVPIILCDIQLPGRDGVWLVERVRAKWPHTAIIMATGVDDPDTIQKTQSAGAVDYVRKPFGREELLQALRRAQDFIQ